jgi:hypothetical protein
MEKRVAEVVQLLYAQKLRASEVKRICSKRWSAPAKDGTPAKYPVKRRCVEPYLCRARKRVKELQDMSLRDVCRSALAHYWGIIARADSESEARVDRAYRELLLMVGGYAPTKHAATDTAGNDLLLSGQAVAELLAAEQDRQHLAALAESLERRRAQPALPAPAPTVSGHSTNGLAPKNGHPHQNGNGHQSNGHNGDGH